VKTVEFHKQKITEKLGIHTDAALTAYAIRRGIVKQKAGQVTNNPNLETKGQGEKLAGKVQKKVGQIEEVLEK